MFTAHKRPLPFPLDRAANLERVVPEGLEICGLPEFPEDSDEQITVLFRLSLNQFVALATAVDVGSDIAYGDDGIPVWFLWMASVMCAQFCEEMAECFENENEDVVAALANLLANNPIMQRAIAAAAASQGAPVPGSPLPDTTRHENALPENVKDEFGDCNFDALWGGLLGLVQYGNRAISDFFEILEVGTNSLERGAIATGAIPAAGNSISSAIQFADQLLEEVAEGYAAAYTETYEQGLACALFCAARQECDLNINQMIQIMVDRLSMDDVNDFAEVMNYIITGTFVGDEIADVAFLLFFTAIKYGTEFAGVVAVRALTVQMGLGADFLASDNWIALCTDCPEGIAFNFYADFLQTILVETYYIELGLPFDIVVNPEDYPYGEIVVKPIAEANYRLTYTAEGDIEPTIAETAWSFQKPDDDFESDTPGVLDDMPSPADGKLWFWNNAEALDGIATYTLHVTIDEIP